MKSDLQVTFCFAVKVQLETPEHLDLLNFYERTNGQETFLNNPQEAGNENEIFIEGL